MLVISRHFGPRLAVAALSAALVGAACGGTSTASPSAPAPAPAATSTPAATAAGALKFPANVTFGHSFCYLNNEGMQIYHNSEIAAAQSLGWKTLQATASGNSPSQQLTDVNTLVTQGANVIAIVPCDSAAIIPAVQKAAAAGVAVVMIDIGAGGGKGISVVADEVQAGTLACQGLVPALKQARGGKASGSVVQIQGEITSDAAQGRTKGFEDCIKQDAPDVRIITVPTKFWNPTEGANGLQTTVAAHPDIVGVYMQSDTQYWTGTKRVLQDAGLLKKVGESGHVVVVGVDGGTGMLQGMRDGFADADVSQPKTTYFLQALPFAAIALSQGVDKLASIDTNAYKPLTVTVTADGGLYVKAPNILVTAATASDTGLWGNSTCSKEVKGCPTAPPK